MASRAASATGLRSRSRNHIIRIPRQQPPRNLHRCSCSSKPWYVVFIFVIPLEVDILQLHFQDSSPFDTHPANMWVFVFAVLLYCIALCYYIQSWFTGSGCCKSTCDKVAYISGLLASAAVMSVLVPSSLEPFVFVVWMVISTMFADVVRNWILQVAQKLHHFIEDAVSYVGNIWRRITGNIEATTGAV